MEVELKIIFNLRTQLKQKLTIVVDMLRLYAGTISQKVLQISANMHTKWCPIFHYIFAVSPQKQYFGSPMY